MALDAKRGLITPAGAKRYGVVINDAFGVDLMATEALRQAMADERESIKLFDTGGSVEQLKARCKADTHLDPPTAPRFQTWTQAGAGR